MADTQTTNLNLTKPEPGAAEDTWGISLNADLDALDAIFSTSGTQINLNPNQINFADGKKLIFGTGSDLQIYHNASDGASFIKESGSGHLRIQGSELLLEATNGDNFFRGIENGSVRIYHDNSTVLQTTSSGIDITGNATFDDNGKAIFGNSSDLQIYHDGSHSYIQDSGSGNLRILVGDMQIRNYGTNENIITSTANAEVALYYNASEKLATTSAGINVTGTVKASTSLMVGSTDAPARDLEIKTTNPHIRLTDTDASGGYTEIFGGSGITTINADKGQAVAGSVLKLSVDATDGLTINSNHNVDIPNGNLNVTGTVTSDGLTVDGTISAYRAGFTQGVQLLGDSGGNQIIGTATNDKKLIIKNLAATQGIEIIAGNKVMDIARGGDISFYDDTGSTQGLFWDASAEKLGLGTTAPQELLHLEATEPLIRFDDTNSGLHYILGQDGDGFKFTTNNSTYGKYTFDSKVGIGTDSPSEKLHVIGGAFLGSTTHASDSRVTINGSVGGISNALTVKNSSASTSGRGTRINLASSNTEIGRIEARTVTDSTSGSLSLSTASSGSMSTALFIDSSQRVGIGTTSPSNPLHVIGSRPARFERSGVGAIEFNIDNINTDSAGDLVFEAKQASTGFLFRPANSSNSMINALAINRDGKVGIGTSSIDAKLHVESSSDTFLRVEKTGADNLNLIATGAGSRVRGSGDLIFDTGGGNERARIKGSNGYFGIGTSSPSTTLHVADTSANITIQDSNSSGNTAAAKILFADSGTFGTIGTIGFAGNDDLKIENNHTGNILLSGGNVGIGTTSPDTILEAEGATAEIRVTATTTNGGIGLHALSTNASTRNWDIRSNSSGLGTLDFRYGSSQGAAPSNIAMTLDSSGNLLVGKTASNFTVAGHEIKPSSFAAFTRADGVPLIANRLSSDGAIIEFYKGTSSVGTISVTSSATSYNTSSDARLKDVTGEARGLEVITKLNPVAYNWKADGKADEGLIAQEVKELVPNAVTGSEDEHYQMDYSKLVTHLVKGMKEQQEQIESLKSEIANLKGE